MLAVMSVNPKSKMKLKGVYAVRASSQKKGGISCEEKKNRTGKSSGKTSEACRTMFTPDEEVGPDFSTDCQRWKEAVI